MRASAPRDTFLHILKPVDRITLPRTLGTFTAFAFGTTTPLPLVQHDATFELKLPETARTPIDSIIVLSPLGLPR